MSINPNVFLNQGNFRILLNALSNPGKIFHLKSAEKGNIYWPLLAALECLLDREVSFYITGPDPLQICFREIIERTYARTAKPEEADFIILLSPYDPSIIQAAKKGESDHPEKGATLFFFLNTSGQHSDRQPLIRFKGPGIESEAGIPSEMYPIPLELIDELALINTDYPLGLDSFFIGTEGEVMGLPRSTIIETRENAWDI